MDIAALKKEAKSKKTPATRLEQLARQTDTSIQQAVAGNPSTPAAALEYLGGHGKFNILKAVAKNPNTPDAVLEKLSRHKQATVREAVAGRAVLPETIALHFAKGDEKALKIALFCNNHGPKVWDVLGQDPDEDVRESTAMEETISDALFEQLLSDPSPAVRSELGYNEKIQNRRDWLGRLAKDPEPFVRKSAVVYADLKMLERLAHDPADMVRCAVAESENLNTELARLLLKDSSEDVRTGLADNYYVLEKTPAEISLALAADASEKVRWTLAGNDTTHPEGFEVLASDANSHIRWRVAENSRTPIAVLQELTKDKDKYKFCYADEFSEPQDPHDFRTTIAQEAKAALESLEKA